MNPTLTQTFANLALSFPHTEQAPHHDRTAFKIIGRRIFATLHPPSATANLRLSVEEQAEFCSLSATIYPVPNKWGQQGWTTFELIHCAEEVLKSGLESAYLHAKMK